MTGNANRRRFSRREFLKLGGGVLGTAFATALMPRSKALLSPMRVESQIQAAKPEQGIFAQTGATPNKHIIATDGWIHLPPEAVVAPYHPDNMAPEGLTTYIFGFRDATMINNQEAIFAQKMQAQLTAPVFWIDEGTDFTVKITNLGLKIRPDLIDAHTLHFHGFRNALPIFDGEPHSSVGVPIVRDLTYFYRPHYPGTYMYHCHFEETEHVHMGMVGQCFVRPALNQTLAPRQFAYNDETTEYDREFTLLMNEVWTESHWADSHVQLPEWSDYAPEFWLLNGRVYPDTIEPNGQGTDPNTGEMIAPLGRPDLKYQPISSLITCEPGDRVLLRFANLGYEQQSMKLTGLKMRIIGRDAMPLRSTGGLDMSQTTDTVTVGPGESVDAIFVAPNVTELTKLLLYNRNYNRLSNGGHPGYGGQMTEVHIYPTGSLIPQSAPNDWALA